MSYDTSYLASLDTPSTIYPDRLIRPLPKRTIKSRLSQETADSITYPPSLPSISLPTYNHYGENEEYMNNSKVLVHQDGDECEHDHDHDHDHDHEHDHDHDRYHDHDHCHHHHHHCHHDDEDEDDLDSADDSSPATFRHAQSYRSSPRSPRSARQAKYGNHTAKSSNTGPDGYEAFENTNNKKKRKIPTSGSLSLNNSTLTSSLANMGLSNGKDGVVDSYYLPNHAAGPSGLGLQGAGRGRNGRKLSGRNPLGVSVNGTNMRAGPSKNDQNLNIIAKAEESKGDQGIISAAIANATALLRKPLSKGQENVGVLDQQAKSSHTNSQFTFTCEADAKGVTFPEQSLYSPGYSQRGNYLPTAQSMSNQRVSTHGTQTSPHAQSQTNQRMSESQQGTTGLAGQGKKTRRRRGDVYSLAARQRKLQQEYANLQHPPPAEDIWICEFCEYESIFGEPPHALIRQYEIKDRKEQRRLAEKRRLLEKAKLKGRKGKKQTKNAAKAANNAAQQTANQQGFDQQPLDQFGDDDLDYGYDDDPIPMPPPPPQVPTKQSMPGSYSSSIGKTGGGGIATGDGGGGGIGRGGIR